IGVLGIRSAVVPSTSGGQTPFSAASQNAGQSPTPAGNLAQISKEPPVAENLPLVWIMPSVYGVDPGPASAAPHAPGALNGWPAGGQDGTRVRDDGDVDVRPVRGVRRRGAAERDDDGEQARRPEVLASTPGSGAHEPRHQLAVVEDVDRHRAASGHG